MNKDVKIATKVVAIGLVFGALYMAMDFALGTPPVSLREATIVVCMSILLNAHAVVSDRALRFHVSRQLALKVRDMLIEENLKIARERQSAVRGEGL